MTYWSQLVKDVPAFKKWLIERGYEVRKTSNNKWECLRFARKGNLYIIYKDASGCLSFTGEVGVVLSEFMTQRGSNADVSRMIRRKSRTKLTDLIDRDGLHCFYCDVLLTEATVTIEHACPVSAGGPEAMENLLLACEDCNQVAGAKSVAEKVRLREAMMAQNVKAEK